MKTLFTAKQFSKNGGNKSLPASAYVVLPKDAGFPLKKRAAAVMAEISRKSPSRLQVTCGVISDEYAFLRCVRNGRLSAQGYRLNTVKSPAVLEASTDAGFFYGLLELVELIATNHGSCPKCEIADAPELSRRGYMLDVSRGKIPTMDTLKMVVESISRLRYNEFELYMEHPFTFTGDEDIWFETGAFTPEQIQELDAFCQEHFITLIPNFNCFGHLTRWFGAERYKDLSECENGWYFEPWDCIMHSVMTPGPKANDFLERHLGELLPNFTATECNIGFDETFELGHGKSKELCDKIGQGKLFFKHLQTVTDIIAKYGKKPQMWGDMAVTHPELMDMLPKSITPIVWKYEEADEFEADCALFKKNGFQFLTAPGTAGWTTFCGRVANMLINIDKAIDATVKYDGAGTLLTDWGDFNHTQHYIICWPGLAYTAIQAWRKTDDARKRLPDAIRFAFTPEAKDSTFPELLLELGHCGDDVTYFLRGKNAFCLAMFGDDHKMVKRFNEMVKAADLRSTQRRITRLRQKLAASDLPASALHVREFANTLDIIEGALAVLMMRVNMCPAGTPLQRKMRMSAAIAEFRELWLARNISGGLATALPLIMGFLRA